MAQTELNTSKLDTNYFRNDLDITVFKEILKTLDWITPIFVTRKEFNEKKWNILTETWNDKFWKKFDMFLPDDLKVSELPAIILRINKLSFKVEIPKYASTNELKVKIVMAIDILISELKKNNSSDEEIQKAIKNYTNYILSYSLMKVFQI